MTGLFRVLQLLPMAVFMGVARSRELTNEAWEQAFYAGAVAALLTSGAALVFGKTLNRLLLAVYLFLVAGAAGFFWEVAELRDFYGRWRAATLFLSLAAVGAATTFFTRAGYIEIEPPSDPAVVRRFSLLLLLATLGALGVSAHFNGDPRSGGLYPFLAIAVLRIALRKRAFSG